MMMSGVTVAAPHRFRARAITTTKLDPEIDEAGRSLRSVARGVVLRAHESIEACAAASHGPIECRGYSDVAEIADRAWRFSYDRREMFCVLDNVSERLLLGWIVGGGHPARAPSSIERSIVAESMRRLLSVAAYDAPLEIHEEPSVRPHDRSWRCDVRLSGPDRERATIQLFTELALPPQTRSLICRPDLREVALQLRATLPSITCALADVWEWRSGSLLRLQRSGSEISVGLYAGGRRVALAQLGTVFGDRAVKLVTLATQVHR